MPCQVDDTSIAAALELVERAVADADELLLLLRVERDRETRVAAEQAIPPPPPPPPQRARAVAGRCRSLLFESKRICGIVVVSSSVATASGW